MPGYPPEDASRAMAFLLPGTYKIINETSGTCIKDQDGEAVHWQMDNQRDQEAGYCIKNCQSGRYLTANGIFGNIRVFCGLWTPIMWEISRQAFGLYIATGSTNTGEECGGDLSEEQETSTKDEQVAEKEGTQITIDPIPLEKDQQIAKQNTRLAERDRELGEVIGRLASLHQELAQIRHELAEKSGRLAETEAALRRAEEQLASRDAKLLRIRDQLDEVKAMCKKEVAEMRTGM
ncbi:hypothetical protein FRC10_002405 [Ceratobasidium sp. 414]|nr:hypothetical protein FRC10_002405 [Ceratobasidium sp. 414]